MRMSRTRRVATHREPNHFTSAKVTRTRSIRFSFSGSSGIRTRGLLALPATMAPPEYHLFFAKILLSVELVAVDAITPLESTHSTVT